MNGVYVIFENGDVYIVDYVFVIFSIGVFKSGFVQFIFEFFNWKFEVIFKLNMVIYIKIFVKFFLKFWDDEEYIFYVFKRRGYYFMMQNLEVDFCLLKGINIFLIIVMGEEFIRLEYQDNE